VTLAGLSVRNAFLRNKTRAFLTVLGVVITTVAFLFLRTVLTAWYASSEASSADRIVTRNAISLTQSLPLSYSDRIAQVPGVTRLTWSNWFGGIYKDRKNFFAQFAIDATSALEVFDIRFVQGNKADFLGDRNACIVGKGLAEKFGWKVGDTVPLFSEIYPGDWKFRIAGVVEGADDASIANTMYFHWARLNEGLPDRIKNSVGVFTMKVANANDSPRVIRDVDALFANSEAETHTETEKAFRLQFVTGSSAILTALQVVSAVILVIMALILGNTMAMGLRERTGELGVMRAIGFLPKDVRALAFREGAMLGALGGLIGCLLAQPVLRGVGRVAASIGFLSNVSYTLPTAALTVAIAALIGAAASALPAVQAARMEIVNALRRQE
jgi:putative ABC transport system permease protein